MKKNKIHTYIIFLLGLIFLASCHSVVLKVEDVPSNTPADQSIFVVGNFNNWDPGGDQYRMTLGEDSAYYLTLPPGFGTVEFKFTRGDWTTVEKDICGYEIDNHYFKLGNTDTVVQSVASWGDLDPVDCPRLTLVLKDLPENTPVDDLIVVAGDFNSWDPDAKAIMEKDRMGDYRITIPRPKNKDYVEFKVTRGDLATSEADEFGSEIPSRKVKFGQKDTVELDVKGWIDKPVKLSNRVCFIIENIPEKTPGFDDIYLVSNMNNWTPGDRNYVFQRNKDWQLFLTLPKKSKSFEYKLTRGNWQTVEVDKYGYDTPNRKINMHEEDTVYLDVKAWKDLTRHSIETVTIVLTSLPESTPSDSKIYIAGSFNNWNPSRSKFRFSLDDQGHYFVNIPRDRYNFKFVITRGSLQTIEVDQYGSAILSREYAYSDTDTVFMEVENWEDLPKYKTNKVTLVLNSLPSKTPAQDIVFLVSDFNGWNPMAASMVFKYLEDGRPYYTIQKDIDRMEYKITRGGWEKVEVDNMGLEIPNRRLTFGFADTVYIDVIKWRDFDGTY